MPDVNICVIGYNLLACRDLPLIRYIEVGCMILL